MATVLEQQQEQTTTITLSRREAEVLSLMLEGKTSKEVADILFCTKRTVDFHLNNIYKKLHVSNRIQALRQAVRLGLVSDPADGFRTAV